MNSSETLFYEQLNKNIDSMNEKILEEMCYEARYFQR